MTAFDASAFTQFSQNRRQFLLHSGCGLAAMALGRHIAGADVEEVAIPPRHNGPRPKIAGVYTELREKSHAYHILESHMGPYLFNGELTDPGVDVVSFYADQFPENDMTREVVQRLNMPLYDSIAGALTLGTGTLSVDGVLLIGEHGDYPRTELGQVMYPRKRFFDEAVAVMDKSKRYVPLFNDKHLSYRWDWAKEMYDTARDRGIPFMAGSSVPLSQRIPDVDLPDGAQVLEAVSIHGGPLESYDFHGFEVLQSIVEKRDGGETGITSVQVLKGEELMNAAKDGRWSPDLATAAMQAELGDSFKGISLVGPNAVRHGLLLNYADGLKGTVLAVGGSADRWNFGCRVKGKQDPLVIKYFAGPWGNRNLFRALSHAIQHMFITGKPAYPVERTLLASGVLDAAMHSHHQGGKPIPTPHLEFSYRPIDFSAMRERGKSWEILTRETPHPPKFEPGDLPTLARQRSGSR